MCKIVNPVQGHGKVTWADSGEDYVFYSGGLHSAGREPKKVCHYEPLTFFRDPGERIQVAETVL